MAISIKPSLDSSVEAYRRGSPRIRQDQIYRKDRASEGMANVQLRRQRRKRGKIKARPSIHYLANSTPKRECPISIRNDVDDEVLPSTFQFVDRVIHSPSIPPIEEDFISGCECNGPRCVTTGCSCLGDIDADAIPGIKRNAYHATGQLKSAYLDGGYPIYECGPRYACASSCPNRVVQQGRKIPLEIFKM